MPSKKKKAKRVGFFCTLPAARITAIKRAANRRNCSQGAIVEVAVDRYIG